MKRLLVLLVFVILPGLRSGAQEAPSAPPPEVQADAASGAQASESKTAPGGAEERIRVLLREQVAAWNRGDLAGFMRGYWNSPQTEFVGRDGVLRGWRTVFDRYRKAYPDRAAMGHLDFSSLEVTPLAPDAALVVGHWRLKRGNDTSGGAFTLVFRELPEGWRIINDHSSETRAP